MGQGGWPVLCLGKQIADFCIAGLRKVLVPQTNGIERLWCLGTHHLVRHRFQLLAHGTGSNRDCHDNPGRLLLTSGHDGSAHGRTGRQAIIGQNDCASMHGKRRLAPTIVQRAPLQFLLLLGRDSVDDGEGNLEKVHDIFIEDPHATAGNGAHSQLLVPGHSQFTYEKYVERCVQPLRHSTADWDTTTGQRQHQYVRTVGIPL